MSALAVALATFGAGACAGGAEAQAAWQPNRKLCVQRDVTMPPAVGLLARMASECDAAASDSDRDRAANAAYNAARAYNELAEAMSDPASGQTAFTEAGSLSVLSTATTPSAAALQAHAAAIERLGTSLILVKNDDPRLLSEGNKQKRLANDRFRLGRAYEKARALAGLGAPAEAGAPPSARPCAPAARENCYGEAIRQLNDNEALAAPFGGVAPSGDIRYDSFVYLRGRTYAALGDSSRAIADLEKVVSRPQVGPKAQAILAEITVKAGQDAARDKTVAGQNAAIVFFQKAINANAASVDANLGLGDAYFWLGDNTPASKRDNFDLSTRYYNAAVGAATDGPVKGRAYEGLGRSLLAMSALPGAPDAASLLQNGINAYTEAARLSPNSAEPRLNLARALDRAGQLQQANKAFEDAIRLMPAASPLTANALMELAAVKTKLKAPPAQVRATYESAKTGNPQSARPDYYIGISYFNEAEVASNNGSLLANAAQSLQSAIAKAGGASGPPAPGEADIKADAYYYLSMVSARRGALADAVTQADEAVRLAGGKASYRDHACAAHIVRGGTSVASENSQMCGGSDGKPEGLLLRGLFYLRNAQYAAASAKGISRDTARFAFDQGLNEAARATTPGALDITFKWPGSPSPPPVRDLLEYGKAKAAACQGLSSTLALSADQLRAVQAFYNFYRVEKCEPN